MNISLGYSKVINEDGPVEIGKLTAGPCDEVSKNSVGWTFSKLKNGLTSLFLNSTWSVTNGFVKNGEFIFSIGVDTAWGEVKNSIGGKSDLKELVLAVVYWTWLKLL